jgi:hypothetical protein
MQSKAKLGAASLTLAVFMSGCAPMPGATPQASATGDYGNTSTAYNAGGSTGYDYGTGTTTPAASTGSSYYDYGNGSTTGGSTSGSGYDSYYGGSSTTGTSGTSGSYYDYSGSGSSSYGSGGGSNGSATGSYAVQVVASPNRNTAEAMRSQMQSAGFTAVIDQVGGYYKVRIPYSSASEAKASLGRIRSTVPDAFYTTR